MAVRFVRSCVKSLAVLAWLGACASPPAVTTGAAPVAATGAIGGGIQLAEGVLRTTPLQRYGIAAAYEGQVEELT